MQRTSRGGSGSFPLTRKFQLKYNHIICKLLILYSMYLSLSLSLTETFQLLEIVQGTPPTKAVIPVCTGVCVKETRLLTKMCRITITKYQVTNQLGSKFLVSEKKTCRNLPFKKTTYCNQARTECPAGLLNPFGNSEILQVIPPGHRFHSPALVCIAF